MPRQQLLAAAVFAFIGGLPRADAQPAVADFVLQVPAGPTEPGFEVLASRANAVPLPHADSSSGNGLSGTELQLVVADPADGCRDVQIPAGMIVPGAPPFALLVARGGCNFGDKVAAAIRAGATLVAVYNTLGAAYVNVSSSYALTDPCSVDCGQATFQVHAAGDMASPVATAQRLGAFSQLCGGADTCASGECAVAGVLDSDVVSSGDALKVCCLPDEPMVMNLGEQYTMEDMIPAVYVRRSDADSLLAAAARGSRVHASERARMAVDPSVLCIWALGVFAVVTATWLATAKERAHAALHAAASHKAAGWAEPGRTPAASDSNEEDTLDLTAGHALAFVVVASISLVAMFVLLQLGMFWVIRVIQIFFCLGCITAIFQFGSFPAVHALQPRLFTHAQIMHTESCGTITAADLIAVALAVGLVTWYYVCRHASYAWVLQDLMALAMCALFLKTVRLPSVRVAAVLLCVFFVYDVFMVFISPLIFKKSVMVEVATAGAAGNARTSVSDGGRTCVHIEGERMPVLFMLPRFDFGGGYSMLGLGDVVMPGLLVCFALRYDLLTRGAPRAPCGMCIDSTGRGGVQSCAPWYFAVVSVGYAVGLMLALLANLFGLTFNGVRGQPALLYLVPCTLLPVIGAAFRRGELARMWSGEALDEGGDHVEEGGAGSAAEGTRLPERWVDASETPPSASVAGAGNGRGGAAGEARARSGGAGGGGTAPTPSTLSGRAPLLDSSGH